MKSSLCLASLVLALGAPVAQAQDVPFSVGRVFFQLNNTDGDLGFHAQLDGEAWKSVGIKDPSDRYLLQVNVRGRLLQQGLTELAVESAEPGFEDLPPAQFFARFPPGIYDLEGLTLDGQEMDTEVRITHVLPAPPAGLTVNGLPTPADCGSDPGPTVSGPVVIRWNPVTTSHPTIGVAGPVTIDLYEIAIEVKSPVPSTKQNLTVNLPGNTTQFEIPAGFLALGDSFGFQILARNAGGNETATVTCFEVASH